MDKNTEDFKNISLTGRLCYLFMCIESYLSSCYPDRDWTLVAEKMWQWTSGYCNEGCDVYTQIIPDYLFEFDTYIETNEREFDGELSEEDYYTFVNLYEGITDGNSQDEINKLLMLPVDFNNECECTDFSYADTPTLNIISKAQSILYENGIEIPSKEKIEKFSVDEKGGWGDFFDSRYLSVLLK